MKKPARAERANLTVIILSFQRQGKRALRVDVQREGSFPNQTIP